MPPTQENRPFEVTTSLDTDELLFYRLNGKEELGRLFSYEVELLSESHSIAIGDVLGQHMSIRVGLRGGGTRYFDGVVSRFSYAGTHGLYARYTATLRPWLWFLTKTADCRVFQGDSTIDIMRKLFEDNGFSDADLTQATPPPPRDYCVQYRESDFNFLSRLLEEDGIYYYFTHEEGTHNLILADGVNCHATQPDYEEISFSPEGSGDSADEDHFLEWYDTQEVRTGIYAHTDYDFTKPKAPLETKRTISRDHPQAGTEFFDYPGLYKETTPGEDIARIRIEELQSEFEVMNGSGTVRGLGVGDLFTLVDHPRDSLNRDYLVISATYELSNPEYQTGGGGTGGGQFRSKITAIEDRIQYRPARTTPKPLVEGPQTATVTGSGEDPWTDAYGRIKVHFHWDRNGETNEESSCFIRVAQASAGKNWGSMFLPHPGQEVIVDFLEGDPDQPIAIGCVYNEDNRPPKDLPDQMHVSIIRDKFGNQLAFDATPGSEHIRLYSPSKQSALVLGQSRIDITESTDTKIVLGNKYSHFRGNSDSFTYGSSFSYRNGTSLSVSQASSASLGVGASFSGFIGAKASISLGVEASYSVATKIAMGYSRSISSTKGEYARVSDNDIKHDSNAEVWLAGGENDESIVKAAPDEILLQYGTGADRPSVRDLGKPAALFGLMGGIAAAAAQHIEGSAQVASANEAASWATNTGPDNQTSHLDTDQLHGSTNAQVGQGVAAAAAFAGAVAGVIGSDVADPTHTSYKSRVKLDEKGVFIGSGNDKTVLQSSKGVKLNAQDKATFIVDDSGMINLVAEKDIKLQCKGKILLEQDMECSESGYWAGKIWNPNFEANK